MNLVIVESPAKSKTINNYLGKDYKVVASFGHIRELPSKNNSVETDNDFKMIYVLSSRSKKHFDNIVKLLKGVDKLILATDPDREGEAISWHIVDELTKRKKLPKNLEVQRVVFNEITKSAVQQAIANPRNIDIDLVRAQQSRQALDYLVGFNLSPILWRKLPGSRSAGRVQSVALRIICEREAEIEKFVSQEYWSVFAKFLTEKNSPIEMDLVKVHGNKLKKLDLKSEEEVKKLSEDIKHCIYNISSIAKKKVKRHPLPPFTTSTLQQDAVNKLSMGAKYAMGIAQKLYEGVEINGESTALISYMRTDSIALSDSAVKSIRGVIDKNYGKNYLPASKRVYKSKVKNAQEAHEAIRPINATLTPKSLKSKLSNDHFRLYELIWNRSVASQMESAVFDQTTIEASSNDAQHMFKTVGSIIVFEGFLKLYKENLEEGDSKNGKILPNVEKDEKLELEKLDSKQHFTQPPPRYSEASLIKHLEQLGIGRPSTYASIITVLIDRQYVILEKKRFIPEVRGRMVTAFLCKFFQKYVEYEFTASLEEDLDLISNGKLIWKDFLGKFWDGFHSNVDDISKKEGGEILKSIGDNLQDYIFSGVEVKEGEDIWQCNKCKKGRLSVKSSKFGFFLACSTYPECKYTRVIGSGNITEGEQDLLGEEEKEKFLGENIEKGVKIILKKGPYGWYLEEVKLDNDTENKKKKGKKKNKRVSIPSHLSLDEVDYSLAEKLLSLPRVIGNHPETSLEIKTSFGPYGAYLLHDGKYVNFDPVQDNLFSLGINRAVTLIDDKKKNAKSKSNKTSNVIKELGKHPNLNSVITVCNGRYGPYIKCGKINVSIQKDKNADNITLQEAIDLLKSKL